MSEIMLQQTTVATVGNYFIKFIDRWPTVDALAVAEDADVMAYWAGLGYYARARNLLKCARAVSELGAFPQTYNDLIKLPGIGPYTAAAVSSIAFDEPSPVMDGNVERVMARLFDIHTPLPAAKPELYDKTAELTPQTRAGDYAQAVMDLGATICTPKTPSCDICPWRTPCSARQNGTAAKLPNKTPKGPKPTRHGIAYVLCSDAGALLLETRPEKGLLGGMLGWPTSDWSDKPTPTPPLELTWTKVNAQALHTFTHFHLRLDVMIATVEGLPSVSGRHWVEKLTFQPSTLPTVMRKVWDIAREA
jgi:A/G-specific adenine glycosylase